MTTKGRKPKAPPEVVSLHEARQRREVEGLVDEINQSIRGMTDRIGEIVDVYHRWEAQNPDKAVSSRDKLEMVSLGFVGPAGFIRCHEEHRVPRIALHGMQAGFPTFDPTEEAERAMCPALESGRCQSVLQAFPLPPCILLGGEVQQAFAPNYLSSVGEAVLDGSWRSSPAEEKKRFARAKALVRKHDKLEDEAERRGRKKPE